MDYKENIKKQVEQSITELTYHYNTLKVLTPVSRYKDINHIFTLIMSLHRVILNLNVYSRQEIYNQLVFLLGEVGLYSDKLRNKDVTTAVKLFRAKQSLIRTIKEDLM